MDLNLSHFIILNFSAIFQFEEVGDQLENIKWQYLSSRLSDLWLRIYKKWQPETEAGDEEICYF